MTKAAKEKKDQSSPPVPCEVLFACTLCRASYPTVPRLFTHYRTAHKEEVASDASSSSENKGSGDKTGGRSAPATPVNDSSTSLESTTGGDHARDERKEQLMVTENGDENGGATAAASDNATSSNSPVEEDGDAPRTQQRLLETGGGGNDEDVAAIASDNACSSTVDKECDDSNKKQRLSSGEEDDTVAASTGYDARKRTISQMAEEERERNDSSLPVEVSSSTNDDTREQGRHRLSGVDDVGKVSNDERGKDGSEVEVQNRNEAKRLKTDENMRIISSEHPESGLDRSKDLNITDKQRCEMDGEQNLLVDKEEKMDGVQEMSLEERDSHLIEKRSRLGGKEDVGRCDNTCNAELLGKGEDKRINEVQEMPSEERDLDHPRQSSPKSSQPCDVDKVSSGDADHREADEKVEGIQRKEGVSGLSSQNISETSDSACEQACDSNGGENMDMEEGKDGNPEIAQGDNVSDPTGQDSASKPHECAENAETERNTGASPSKSAGDDGNRVEVTKSGTLGIDSSESDITRSDSDLQSKDTLREHPCEVQNTENGNSGSAKGASIDNESLSSTATKSVNSEKECSIESSSIDAANPNSAGELDASSVEVEDKDSSSSTKPASGSAKGASIDSESLSSTATKSVNSEKECTKMNEIESSSIDATNHDSAGELDASSVEVEVEKSSSLTKPGGGDDDHSKDGVSGAPPGDGSTDASEGQTDERCSEPAEPSSNETNCLEAENKEVPPSVTAPQSEAANTGVISADACVDEQGKTQSKSGGDAPTKHSAGEEESTSSSDRKRASDSSGESNQGAMHTEEQDCVVTYKKNVPLGMLKGKKNSLMVIFQHANESKPLPEGTSFTLRNTAGQQTYVVVANVDVEIREYGKQSTKA